MKKFYSFIAVTLLLFVFASCATIFTGSSQNVSIKSTPEKANITIKTMGGIEVFSGVTPIIAPLSKKHDYLVSVKLDGYKESTVQITQELQGWFWGNLFCGGIVGMIIDYSSGAMWNLEPQAIQISLVTAYNNGNETQTYAVCRALDNEGQLRMLVMPLIKAPAQVALK
ncbi:MAG: PEGA domain-containing protein [Ignavibacteria bacterium]